MLESRPRLGESIVDYYPVLKIKCQAEGKIQHKLNISFSLGEFMLGSDILHQAVGATGGAKYFEIPNRLSWSLFNMSKFILKYYPVWWTHPHSYQSISVANFHI